MLADSAYITWSSIHLYVHHVILHFICVVDFDFELVVANV